MLPGFKWGVVDLTATTVDEYVKALALEAEEYTANADEGEYVATTGVTDADRFSLALLSAAHHAWPMPRGMTPRITRGTTIRRWRKRLTLQRRMTDHERQAQHEAQQGAVELPRSARGSRVEQGPADAHVGVPLQGARPPFPRRDRLTCRGATIGRLFV